MVATKVDEINMNMANAWIVESVLSAVKRIFGERVRATSIEEIFREAKMKFICYNILLNCV